MADVASGGFPSRSTSVMVVTTITLIVASLFVFARLVSRFAIVRRHTLDDYVMIFAWFCAFGLSFSIDYGTSKGLGRHDADIPTSWFPALRRSEYAFSVLYNVALMATKSSILIFYLRLAQNTDKLLRIASYVTLGVVNVAGIVLTFLNVFQCAPVSAVFDSSVKNAQCMSIVTLYLASAPINIITDLAILVLPIPVLTAMRLPQKQKTILVVTFALGIFVVIVDVVRIYYLQQSAVDVALGSVSSKFTTSRIGGELDFAWYASLALMWSAVEVNVGIICANIPTLKPLVKRILPSMITDLSSHDTEKMSPFNSMAPLEVSQTNPRVPGPVAVDHASGGIRPLPPAQLGNDQEREMDMLDFLTTPGDVEMTKTHTHHTATTDNSVYFGFVNVKRPKSMLNTTQAESFKYCTLVTILFFLWGFSYGLLNTLNNEISTLSLDSQAQSIGLETAYFGAYFAGPLTVGQYVLRHCGFKATFITGLCIYGVGTLMFWPSAVLNSYPGFITSNLVVGFGLSILETAANPFLALCGPERFSEVRLLIAQGVQGIASVLSQILAEKVLFAKVLEQPSLIDVQWAYLAIALFTVILSLFFNYMPLPEATDADLQIQAENLEIYSSQKLFSKVSVIYVTLGLAVFAQFLYTGVQQGVSFYVGILLSDRSTATNIPLTTSVDNYVTLSLVTFTVGRFIAAALCYVMTPRILLLFIFLGGILFSALTMTLDSSPNVVAGPALIFFFLEGPVWPLIFAIGLRGLGRHTKSASAYLTAAASGGAVFPLVMYAAQRVNNQSSQKSFCVAVALFAASTIFPVYLTLSSQARHQVDPRRPASEHNAPTPARRFSKQFQSIVLSKVGAQKRGSRSSDIPSVEHRERNSWASTATNV